MSAAIVTKIYKIEVNWELSPFLLIFDSKLEPGEFYFFFKLEIHIHFVIFMITGVVMEQWDCSNP